MFFRWRYIPIDMLHSRKSTIEKAIESLSLQKPKITQVGCCHNEYNIYGSKRQKMCISYELKYGKREREYGYKGDEKMCIICFAEKI